MTIPKTSKPCIGGATLRRDRADRATEGRSLSACTGYIACVICGLEAGKFAERVQQNASRSMVASSRVPLNRPKRVLIFSIRGEPL